MDKLSERLALVSCIDPDNQAAGTFLGDAIDMSKFHKAVFVVAAGDIGAGNGTVDYSVTGSETSGGSYSLLSGKSITQLTIAGSDSDKQAIIEVDAADCKVAGVRYLKDKLVIGGTANSDVVALAFAESARYAPASDDDLASVDEIVS